MGKARGRCLALAGLLLLTAFTIGGCGATSGSAASITATATLTPIKDPLARIHTVTQDFIPLFVRITFTDTTSYDDATALLKTGPYPKGADPWGCDEPRSTTPPPRATQESAYASSHSLLISYATWDELVWLANSPLVASIDAAATYPCP